MAVEPMKAVAVRDYSRNDTTIGVKFRAERSKS